MSKKREEIFYTHIQYCTIIGATDSIRFVANLKFKTTEKKTKEQWKEIFEKEGLS